MKFRFIPILIKRSKFRGGNVRYSVLPSNMYLHMKGSIYA